MIIAHARLELHVNQKRIHHVTEYIEHLMQLHNLPLVIFSVLVLSAYVREHSTPLLIHMAMDCSFSFTS